MHRSNQASGLSSLLSTIFKINILLVLFFVTPGYAQTELPDSLQIFSIIQANDPSPSGKVVIHQDPRLDEITYKQLRTNLQRNGIPGYRIQIYSGSGTNARMEAMRLQNNFSNQFPSIPSYLVYEEPYFKLRVGNYRSKSDGYKAFKKISEVYPQCYFVLEKSMDYPEFNPSEISLSTE